MTAVVPAIVLMLAAQAGGGPADIETIVRDNMSNVEDAKQAVARTPAEWAALWRLHAGDQPAPKVDLTTRTVIAVFLGTRPSAGYAVEVSGTKRAGPTLTVEWREHAPKPGQMSAQVITAPSHLVSIPKFDGEITFRKVGP